MFRVQRGDSRQGNFKSTSTQQASYEDTLTVECLIRTFKEKVNMEHPVQKHYSLGDQEQEMGRRNRFRRMINCSTEKNERNYGMKELLNLKIKECQMEIDIDEKWATYSLMKAPLNITSNIWINNQGIEKIFKRFLT